MAVQKLKLVIWKQYIIRKRHYLSTLFEILLPILLFTLIAYGRSQIEGFRKEKIEIPTISPEIPFTETLDATTHLYYSPNTGIYKEIIEKVQDYLQLYNNNIEGFETEEKLLKFYREYHNSNVTLIAVNFQPSDGNKCNYTISLPNKYDSITNSLYKENYQFNPFDESPYVDTGFLVFQVNINKAYLEVISGKDLSEYFDLSLQSFPFPPYTFDAGITDKFLSVLTGVTIISFIYLQLALLKRIVEEKQSGIKELLKMVGMEQWMMWFGWFIHALVPMILSVIFVVVVMKVPIFSDEMAYPPIEYSDGTVLFTLLFLYCVALIFFAFALSTLCSLPSYSIILGILIWLGTVLIVNLINIETCHPLVQFLLGLLPNVALHRGFGVLKSYEEREIGTQWNNIHLQPSAAGKEVTMIYVFVLFIIQMILYMILTYYIDNVNPGPFGIRKSFFFPYTNLKKFVKRMCYKNDCQINAEHTHLANVESGGNLKMSIQISNLVKKFGHKVAVDGLSFDIYKDQITVLLGHNGAGKSTTMAMITGMLSATGGSIKVNGKKIGQNIDEIRKDLGLCPQHNLLFPDLTVLEHLVFFSGLKGNSFQTATAQSEQLLKTLNLYDKRNNLAHSLSGGMKRKLCLGMAIVGDSKILILDEPTSGMDPESRRELWNMLLSWRRSKTILITTHFMEEADALGDWIAIMSNGKLQCYGTPMYLKTQYETGYHLSLIVDSNADDVVDDITKYISAKVPNAKLSSKSGSKLVYVLPITEKEKFTSLFKTLEECKADLQINSISVTFTTLEDVFLKAKTDYKPTDMQAIEALIKETFTDVPDSKLKRRTHLPVQAHLHQTLFGLILKRLYYLQRLPLHYIVPAFITFVIFSWTSYLVFTENSEMESTPPMHLSLDMYGKTKTYYNGSTENDVVQLKNYFKNIVNREEGNAIEVPDVIDSIVREGIENIAFYKKHMIAGASFHKEDGIIKATALYSGAAIHSTPISINLVMDSFAKIFLGPEHSISVSFARLPNVRVVSSKEVSLPTITLLWLILIPTAFLFAMGSYLVFPQTEYSNNFCKLQYMCGVLPAFYWFINVIFDLLLALPLIVLITLQAKFWNFFEASDLGVFFLMQITYFLFGLPFIYILSRKKSIPSAFALLFTLGIISIIPCAIVDMLVEYSTNHLKTTGQVSRVILPIIFPHFAFQYNCLVFSKVAAEKYNWNIMPPNKRRFLCKDEMNPCCIDPNSKDCANNFSYTAIYENILLMMLSGILYFLLNIVLDSNLPKKLDVLISKLIYKDEWKRDSTPLINNDDDQLTVQNLVKQYGRKKVVDNINFVAPKGDCTGILGVNGAGKTSTFRMLTRDILQTDGSIFADKEDCDSNKYLPKLGYCPQEDYLNFSLSGRQILKTMAMLRGINDVDETVKYFLKIFDLEKYADQPCGTYSGGNKRKLSTAIALIGLPEYVLLDEPTSGVDPIGRRQFWSIIKVIKDSKKVSFIFTSHSMAECEALCDKVHIMKNGTIQRGNTINKLKEEIGGFTLKLKVRNETASSDDGGDEVDGPGCSSPATVGDLIRKVQETFDCELKDQHSGSLHFHINNKTQMKRLSELFASIEEIKRQFSSLVEDYSLSEATLEDVFLAVAKSDE